MFALTALGNRSVGHSAWWSNPAGYFLMTVGMGVQLIYWPIILVCLVLWRAPSPRRWLDRIHGGSIMPALLRGVRAVPLVCALYVIEGSLLPMLLIPAPCVLYWLAGKQSRFEPVAVAELATGAMLGIV